MFMSDYRPFDYSVYDRAWSILFRLYSELPNFTNDDQIVPLLFNYHDDRNSNFLPRRATGENLMPLITAEWRSDVASRVAGKRIETWEIAIHVRDEMDVLGLGLNADIFAMMQDVRGVLDGQLVPYYQYSRFPAGYDGTSLHEQYRLAGKDFEMRCTGRSRGSEESERDRNVVRMLFVCEV